MDPKDCKPGTAVLYYPSMVGEKPSFRGIVAEEPRQFSDGGWVVRLRDMEPGYGRWRGTPGRTVVYAASLTHLEKQP